MKIRKLFISLIGLLYIIKVGVIVSAASSTDQIVSLLDQSTVQFGNLDESQIGRAGINAPLRFQLDQALSDQASITFIWDLDHPAKNKVHPIKVEVVDPIQVPMIPQDGPITNQTQLEYLTASVVIHIGGEDLPHYLYVDEQANIVMAVPNYAGNVPQQLWTGYVRRYLKTDNESPLGTPGIFKWDGAAANQALHELNQIGQRFSPVQTYYQYYPQNLDDLLIVGRDWSSFITDLTINGQGVDVGLNATHQENYDYNILGIFSTYAPNQAPTREIVYFLIEHQKQAQVYVIDVVNTSQPTNLVATQNQEIKSLLERHYIRNLVSDDTKSEGQGEEQETTYAETVYDFFELIPKRETDQFDTIKTAKIYENRPELNFEETPLEGLYKVETQESNQAEYVYFYNGLIYLMVDQGNGGVFVTYYPHVQYPHGELPLTEAYINKVLAFIYGQ